MVRVEVLELGLIDSTVVDWYKKWKWSWGKPFMAQWRIATPTSQFVQ